jgi:hypothetical protein
MSDRIAREAVERLRKIALLQSLFATGPDRSEIEAHAADLRAVLADWERLRGLIAFLGEPETAEVVPPSLTQDRDEQVGKGILHEGPWTLTVRQRGGEIPRLMAEARAIREELGR